MPPDQHQQLKSRKKNTGNKKYVKVLKLHRCIVIVHVFIIFDQQNSRAIVKYEKCLTIGCPINR